MFLFQLPFYNYFLQYILMKKIFIFIILLVTIFAQQADDDLVDLTQIPFFPKYNHRIYSGYLNLSLDSKAFHYMYVQSQNDPYNDPFLLWLNGGPGCSSLLGLFSENGPILFKPNTTQAYLNPNSWNLNANVLYLQSPASVGFSTGKGAQLIYNDTTTAKDNLLALRIFFARFPNLKKNDFYIAGQSYAGIYVPTLAQQILNFNKDTDVERINLKGILVGNGCTHPTECAQKHNYFAKKTWQYLYLHGYIDQDQWIKFQGICILGQKSQICQDFQKVLYDRFMNGGTNIYNIYGLCYNFIPKQSIIQEKMMRYEQNRKKSGGLRHQPRCLQFKGVLLLFNTNQYRQVFNINQLNDTLVWTPCSDTLNYTVNPEASYYIYPNLIKAGLKIMVYSGDLDIILPITSTKNWITLLKNELKLPVQRPWRPWVSKSQNISGMVWQLRGITFTSVFGAGHMVPGDKPEQAYTMFNNFIGDQQFKVPDDYKQ